MNRGAKRQHHDQARKRHRHELQQHAREAAKARKGTFPRWLLVWAVALVLVFVIGMLSR